MSEQSPRQQPRGPPHPASTSPGPPDSAGRAGGGFQERGSRITGAIPCGPAPVVCSRDGRPRLLPLAMLLSPPVREAFLEKDQFKQNEPQSFGTEVTQGTPIRVIGRLETQSIFRRKTPGSARCFHGKLAPVQAEAGVLGEAGRPFSEREDGLKLYSVAARQHRF